jgi:polyadenylate-binding protein
MFKEFGTITSAIVMKDNRGESKGYGFVCFSKPAEAKKAMDTLNEKNGLYVSEAKDKEKR